MEDDMLKTNMKKNMEKKSSFWVKVLKINIFLYFLSKFQIWNIFQNYCTDVFNVHDEFQNC